MQYTFNVDMQANIPLVYLNAKLCEYNFIGHVLASNIPLGYPAYPCDIAFEGHLIHLYYIFDIQSNVVFVDHVIYLESTLDIPFT